MIGKIVPHVAIIATIIYMTMFITNLISSNVGMMSKTFTQVVSLILCAATLFDAIVLMYGNRKRALYMEKRRRANAAAARKSR